MKFDNINTDWVVKKLGNEKEMEEFVKFIDNLLVPSFSVANLKIKRQELTNWKKEALIKSNESTLREWGRVNFFDYIWLKLVWTLREANIPFSAIAKLKKGFFEIDDDSLYQMINNSIGQIKEQYPGNKAIVEIEEHVQQNNFKAAFVALFKKYFPPFYLLVLGLMINRKEVSLLINNDGETERLDAEFLQETRSMISFFNKPFVSAPLHSLLDEFYDNPKIKVADQQHIYNLTKLEARVYELLKKEGVSHVTIKLNNKLRGEIFIESVKHHELKTVHKQVSQLLGAGKYSTIKIVQEDGRVIIFEETIKNKI